MGFELQRGACLAFYVLGSRWHREKHKTLHVLLQFSDFFNVFYSECCRVHETAKQTHTGFGPSWSRVRFFTHFPFSARPSAVGLKHHALGWVSASFPSLSGSLLFTSLRSRLLISLISGSFGALLSSLHDGYLFQDSSKASYFPQQPLLLLSSLLFQRFPSVKSRQRSFICAACVLHGVIQTGYLEKKCKKWPTRWQKLRKI